MKYKGFCFFEDGSHTEPVYLEDEEAAIRYLMLQRCIQYNVQIIDEDDFIVMETKNGKGVFPPSLVKLIDEIDKKKMSGCQTTHSPV